jgi:hypothetical protein
MKMRKKFLEKIIDRLESELKGFCRIKHKKGWLDFLEDGELPFTPKKLHETLWNVIDTEKYRPKGKKLFEHHRRCEYTAKADKVPYRPEEALERFIVESNDDRFYNQIPIGGGKESIDIGIEETNSKFIFVELKPWKTKDSPMYAVVESLKNLVEYRVIIERKIKDIKKYNEMDLTVLAPETYFNAYGLNNHKGKIENNKLFNVKRLLKDLSEEFQVGISFMALSLNYDKFLSSCRKVYDRCGISGQDKVKVSKEDKIFLLNRENWKNLVSSD